MRAPYPLKGKSPKTFATPPLHGFEQMIMSTNQQWADGRIGFFLGDRITIQLATGQCLQNPHLITARNFDRLIETSDKAIASSKAPLANSASRGCRIPLPKLFLIPPTWWTTFLHGATAPRAALHFINWSTRNWTSPDSNIAGSTACLWAHSTCTASNQNPECSLIAICMTIDEGNLETVQWAMQHLHAYLPAPLELTTNTTTTPDHDNDYAHNLAQMGQQLLHMAQALINQETDRTDHGPCAPKQLPEDIICNLLGLSSLQWDHRDELPTIWQQLHQ